MKREGSNCIELAYPAARTALECRQKVVKIYFGSDRGPFREDVRSLSIHLFFNFLRAFKFKEILRWKTGGAMPCPVGAC